MNRYNSAGSTDLRDAILQTVAYADVFDYPLTAAEIHRYLTGILASRDEVDRELKKRNIVPEYAGFYMLPGREALAEVRKGREQIAARMWPQAIRYGRLLAGLPFVRMVAVTGSLAMNNPYRDPDIDYFIVTVPGRLWMVRAMALGIARAAAVRGVRLCPNYLVSENALVFPDQTLYAAHELAQMVPISGLDMYEKILCLNRWREGFLPNAEGLPPVGIQVTIRDHPPAIRKILERALRTSPGEWFEGWEMRRKMDRLSREQSGSSESSFAVDYCKGHNLQHGQRTERDLRERLANLQVGEPV